METKVVRILLVDNNAAFLRILQRFLRQHSDLDVVSTVSSAETGLAETARLKPDVIVLDLTLNDMSGLQVIGQLRAALPPVRIVVLTLLDAQVYRQAALTAGADDFVSKVAMTVDLLPAVRQIAISRKEASLDVVPAIGGNDDP